MSCLKLSVTHGLSVVWRFTEINGK